jgi:erythronate-4-phosphate dehydrogenase
VKRKISLMRKLRIVTDENMPLVDEAFGNLGEIRRLPGGAIRARDLLDTDVLLVRSVTQVDRDLLDGTPVRFVGSATIGTDHIDRSFLRERGVAFAHAPGCNAGAVVEYVLAALFSVAAHRGLSFRGRTLGIVGYGQIGSRLGPRAHALGMEVLCNDPPLAEQAEAEGKPHPFLSLDEVLASSDIVSLHVPLNRDAPWPTFHLMNEATLGLMKPNAWLVNSCRGAVVDNAALLRAIDTGHVGAAIMDVWEGEPKPDPALVDRCDLATPHIAGYSYDGKVTGTIMLYEALMDHLGKSLDWDASAVLRPTAEDDVLLAAPDAGLPEAEWLDALVRQAYPIREDDGRMREMMALPREEQGFRFTRLRKEYPRRRAFEYFTISGRDVPAEYRTLVEEALHFTLPH